MLGPPTAAGAATPAGFEYHARPLSRTSADLDHCLERPILDNDSDTNLTMTMHLRNFRFFRAVLVTAVLLAALGAGGCVHRIGIQQGNFLDREDIDRVAVGMTRVQVRALLGTPMVADPFHQSRWDYYFYLKMGRWQHPHRRHFIVYFDAEDKVARIERRGPDSQTTSPEEDEQRTASSAQ